jgi:hypothetical protein
MDRAIFAMVVLVALAGCLSDGVVDESTATVTVPPGEHRVINVSVSSDAPHPHLCYTANGNGSFDVFVFGSSDEYAAYRRGELAAPIAALSSVKANKSNIDPDVDLGDDVEPSTHYVVIDNTDFDAIDGLESGSPSPAGDRAVTVDVALTIAEGDCP